MQRNRKKRINILVINPGSTSTKVAIFENNRQIKKAEISHPSEFLKKFKKTIDQLDYRFNLIEKWVNSCFDIKKLYAVVGRGGLLKPIKGGTYRINNKILTDLRKARYGQHASNLGAIISSKFSKILNIPAFIVDPVTVDEMVEEAKITGLSFIKRKSVFHALNQKAVAKRFAEKIKKPYSSLNLIIAHLGGGITIGAHRKGKVIDVNNGLEEGPFSPERSGSLPVIELVKACYSGRFTKEEMLKHLVGGGGMVSLLGTNDVKKIVAKIKKGNKFARLVFRAMAYNIAKYIGSMAVCLNGKVDAVILTGSLAKSKKLINLIKPKISFLAPVHIYPGEDEMSALACATYKVLSGKEKVKK